MLVASDSLHDCCLPVLDEGDYFSIERQEMVFIQFVAPHFVVSVLQSTIEHERTGMTGHQKEFTD